MLSPLRILLLGALLTSGCAREGVVRGDGGMDGGPDGGTPDLGPRDGGDVTTTCPNDPIDPSAETCSYTAGTGATLIRGDIVVPEGLLLNGHLLIGSDGKVACASCDCSGEASFAGSTVLACAKGLVSPGLINAHEHVTFGEGRGVAHTDRYEHRHDWREGQGGHDALDTPSASSGNDPVLYAELRHLFGGATIVNGSVSSSQPAGLLRNVDRSTLDEGLGVGQVRYETFPLGDSNGTRNVTGCNYPDIDAPTVIGSAIAYTPHIAEGIDQSSRNEFACLSGEATGGSDVILEKTAIVHGVGLLASDYGAMAAEGASLIWSARTNIDLYGHTAPVTIAANAGVLIGLGTDWPASGSMNMLRELTCIYEYNQRNLGGFFTDRQLFDMATSNSAEVLKLSSAVGTLTPGKFADVAIFDQTTNTGYLAAIKGEPKDVALVMRAGEPLYGDAELISDLTMASPGCETVDVCGKSKRACVQDDTGRTIAQLQASVSSDTIELFACGVPTGEPSCIPFRPGEFTGVPMSGDMDGDGVMDAIDNCPGIFNAAREDLDQGAQPDIDGDMQGDACDVCPLDANSTACTAPDPNDRDNDGVPNASDNCPGDANMDQADRDTDMVGDVCDQCPDEPNPAGAPCTGTVYDVKQGNVTGRVRLTNMLVTGVGSNGYFVQTVMGDASYDETLRERFSGVFVFNSADPKPMLGDRVDVDGSAVDFNDQLQLSMSSFVVVSSGSPLPAPIAVDAAEVATGGARARDLEAVLISVGSVTVTDIAPPPGGVEMAPTNEFVVAGALRVNDFMYLADPFPALNDVIPNLQGILRHHQENSKLEPRGPDDLGIPPRLVGFEPAQVYARMSITSTVPPGGFAVRLSRPTDAAVTVMLTGAGVTVPASVEIAAGSDRADVPLTTTTAGTATVTASYDGVNVQGTVIVYDDAAPRRITELVLDRDTIAVSDSVGGMVTIEIPGAVGGTQVTLQVMPATLATVPANVTVPEGAFSATFMVTAGTNTGDGQLIATTPAGSRQVEFTVSATVDRPPMIAGDLVITEIHRNPSPMNEHFFEWFELYNPTVDGIEINGLVVADNNGTHTIVAPNAVIPPGGYAVIAYNLLPADNGGVTAIAAYGESMLLLANGDDVLRLTFNGTEIDNVDWGSGWPNSQGVAICLLFPYAADNNVVASWGESIGIFGTTTDMGTPGIASSAANCQ